MAFWIPMIKTDENEEFVSYVFYTQVVREKNQPYKEGKPRIAVGFCMFNKKNQECILNKERSDEFFSERSGYFDRVCIQLIRLSKKGQGYPDFTAYEA